MHVFAYGSLVDPRCLEEVLGHPHRGERLAARLTGYTRQRTAYRYPFLVESPNGTVDGVLIMDLDGDDLTRLDRYEEVDQAVYCRAQVEVETWGCGRSVFRVPAFAYVGGPTLRASVRV